MPPPNFFRFTQPAWLFAVTVPPGGAILQPDGKIYQFINVTDGGVGAGGSAQADVAKVGGPNVGTYFWAFGEDATSRDGNRGYRAISLNVDYLDDLFHNSFGTPTFAQFTAAASITSVVISAGDLPYVGDTPLASLQDLFVVTDLNGNELFIPPVTTVVVTSIVGAAIGDGFPTAAVTLNFNTAIAPGQAWSTFRVHYRTHKYLNKATPDPIGRRQVGASQHVVAQLWALNGNPSSTTWWNSTYVSNIWTLALSGLNERYRRGTTPDTIANAPTGSGMPVVFHNTQGSGSWFNRLDRAMSGWSQRNLYGLLPAGAKAKYLDPLDAIWTAHLEDYRDQTLLGSMNGRGGASAFVAYGERRLNNALFAISIPGDMPGLSKFMGVTQRRDSAVDAGSFTKITPNTQVQFDTTTTPGTVYINLLNPGDYFHRLVGLVQSGIAVGTDMLEIEHVDGNGNTSRRTYFVSGLNQLFPLRCALHQIDGETPSVPNATIGVLRRWLSMEFFIGDGVDEFRQSLGQSFGNIPRGFIFAQPPVATNTVGNPVPTSPAKFFAGSQGSSTQALVWGGFNPAVVAGSKFEGLSSLLGNGDIGSTVGGIRMSFAEFINNIQSNTGNFLALLGNFTANVGNFHALLGDFIADAGGVFALDGNIAAFNVSGGANKGSVNGINVGNVTQLVLDALTGHTFNMRVGYSVFYSTTAAGAGPGSPLNMALYNIDGGLGDKEIFMVLRRTNPATTIELLALSTFSDAGVTPISNYIDGNLSTPPNVALFLAPVGAAGAVDVFRGRVVGFGVTLAIYWSTVLQVQL